MTREVLPVVALIVSAGAFVLALASTAAQRRRANMEIARSLHIDLTSGLVEGARRPLGEVAFGVRKAWTADNDAPGFENVITGHASQPEDIRHQYFVLLWCFERIWHGYRVIRKDRLLGRHAGEDFAELIRWHVRTWAWSLPAVKKALETSLGKVSDQDSAAAFAVLTDEVLRPADHEFLRKRLREMGLVPIGEPKWAEGEFPQGHT